VSLVVAESDRDLVGWRLAPGASAWDPLGELRSAQAPRWAAGARADDRGFLAVSTQRGGMVRSLELHDESGAEPVVVAGLTPRLDRVRGFDLAVERSSGHALLVYSDGTSRPRYLTHAGSWSASQPLPVNDGLGPTLNTGTVEWIQLVAAPGGDRVALVYSDSLGQLAAIFWDGAAWRTGAGGSSIVTATLKRNAVDFAVQNRAFDAAFEASGDLLIAFGREGQFGFGWSRHDVASNVWTEAVLEPRAPAMGETHFVDLAGEPGSDRIAAALCDLGDGVERLGAATWDGSAWVAAAELDAQARDWNDKAQGRFPCAAGWQGGAAVVVYSDEDARLSWARWSPGGAWALQPDVNLAGVGGLESVLLAGTGDRLVGLLVDDAKKAFSVVYDGAAWTRLTPAPLSDRLTTGALSVVLLGP
jgi:hypothetical protein